MRDLVTRPLFRTLIGASLLALSACTGSGNKDKSVAAATDEIFKAAPDADIFYEQPSPFPQMADGAIIRSRPVTLAFPAGVKMPNQAWQIQYRSRDVNGNPIAAVETVILPMVPKTGPLLSLQFAEDSLGAQCAPSHSLTGGTSNVISQLDASKFSGALAMGWTIVVPDHEGPNSAWEAGKQSAYITLDGIRAALAFAPLQLDKQTPVGLMGYSGGANASAWALSYQPEYAPELNIVGGAIGGLAANLIETGRNADTSPVANTLFFSLVLMAVEGINRAYPDFVTPLLNDKGRAAFDAMKDGCGGNTSDGSRQPSGHFNDYFNITNLFDDPHISAYAPLINLPQIGHAPSVDVYFYHAITDELLPIAGADATASSWCAEGTPLHYYRGIVGEHAAFDQAMASSALTYLQARFTGGPLTVPPGTASCGV